MKPRGTVRTSARLPIPDRILKVLRRERAGLAEDAAIAAAVSFDLAFLECRYRAGEVDFLLSFFIVGVPLLQMKFNQRLQRYGVRIHLSSIFTHQTPIVTLTSTPSAGKSCELGDVCLLATYGRRLPGRKLGNAMILQAKTDVAVASNPVQFDLYENELCFRYYRPSALANIRPCRVFPQKSEPALGYWELGDAPLYPVPTPRTPNWQWPKPVKSPGPGDHPFGDALVGFLCGDSGFPFAKPTDGACDWYQIINDLLMVTARQLAKRKNLHISGVKRSVGPLARHCLAIAPPARKPCVVSGNLAVIQKFYSLHLGELPHFDVGDQSWIGAKTTPAEHICRYSLSGTPPPLDNSRGGAEDSDGGGCNLIFFHFTEQPKNAASAADQPEEAPSVW